MLSSKTSSRKGAFKQGALRTVWCAAHSQSKLNKSSYISTDICTAVERIMHLNPQAPVPMRMSSDLLLGVVRIYSKKVEYLLRDSNSLLTNIQKAFASTDTNLPKNSTSLGKFKLDALDMDTEGRYSFQDNHQKDPKDITLEGQNLTGKDVVVSLNENVMRNSLRSGDYSVTRVGGTIGAEHPDPSNHERLESLSDNYPRTEIRRDAFLPYFSENNLFWADQSEDRLEPDWDLMKTMKETETDFLAEELVPEVSPPSLEQLQQPTSVMSEQSLEFLNSENAYGHGSPTLEIQSTPPPRQILPEQRIQSHCYDHVTILSNRLMKKRIIDSSGILRTKKECPRDALSSWRLNKRIKKDAIFFEPLLTGLGSDLSEAFRKDFISQKPYLTTQSPTIVLSSPSRFMPSPSRGHDFTPAFGSTDTSSLWDQAEETCGDISDLEAFTVTPRSDKVTPVIFSKGRPGVEDTSASDTLELMNSDDGDLSFLAEDNNSSLAGPQESTPDCFLGEKSGKSEVEPLSARTRAVAKFLKNRSATTPVVESHQSVNISLNTILEGKRRKVCARMVFETLVLKNSGLVDVQQEKSFGDVTLTVTPKLSEDLFTT